MSNAQQLFGKELSYNNIIDLNAALELVKEFERPSAIVIKHTNPCGAASADTLAEAFTKAYNGDRGICIWLYPGVKRDRGHSNGERLLQNQDTL